MSLRTAAFKAIYVWGTKETLFPHVSAAIRGTLYTECDKKIVCFIADMTNWDFYLCIWDACRVWGHF